MISIDLLIQFLIDVTVFLSLYLIVTIALNYQYGYTGVPNFGLAFAVAGGAYIAGFLPGRLAYRMLMPNSNLDYVKDNNVIMVNLNNLLRQNPVLSIELLVLTFVVSIAVGGLLGFIGAYPAIRLRADFLMMVLIAMAEVVRIIGMNYEPLAGGTLGISVPNMLAWTGIQRSYIDLIFVAGIAVVVLLYSARVLHSPYGRLLKAVREQEFSAIALGKDIVSVKMGTMVIGSAIAAIAGVVSGIYLGAVVPPTYDRVEWTFWPWLMLLLGGRGSEKGVLVGTSSIVIIRRLVSVYKHYIQFMIPFNVVWLERMALGIVFLVIMVYKPDGLIPEQSFRLKRVHEKLKEG